LNIGKSEDGRWGARRYRNDSVKKEIAKREYTPQMRASGRRRRITNQFAHAGAVYPTGGCSKRPRSASEGSEAISGSQHDKTMINQDPGGAYKRRVEVF